MAAQYVTYDTYVNKIVFDYEEYAKNNSFEFDDYLDWFDPKNHKQNVEDLLVSLEGFRLEIPDKDVFYVWQSNGIDVVDFKFVDNFEEDMNQMIKREKSYYHHIPSCDDDLFGVPGMHMIQHTYIQNGFHINVKHYVLLHDEYCDGTFGYRAITFTRA
jgi:hypothetical protein